MSEVSKGIHVLYTYYITLYYSSRLIKEVTITEFNQWKDIPPLPKVTNAQWKRGDFETQKCPMRWANGAVKALQEAVENYLVGLLTDTTFLTIHATRVTVQPCDIQLARRIKGDKDWEYLEFKATHWLLASMSLATEMLFEIL